MPFLANYSIAVELLQTCQCTMNMPSQDDDKCYYKVAALFKLTTVHMSSAIIFPHNGGHIVGCMVQGHVAGTVFLVLYARVWGAKRNLVWKKVSSQLTFKIVHQ